MRRWSVGLLICTTLLGLAVAASLSPVSAQTNEPAITVRPDTGLSDGDVVTVEGTGFTATPLPGLSWAVVQCRASVVATSLASIIDNCDVSAALPVSATDGTIETTFTVRESLLTFYYETITCGDAPADCAVVVAQNTGTFENPVFVGASVPISFGPDVPATKAECKTGGWRNLANDQGQTFRNEGQCVSFVVARQP